MYTSVHTPLLQKFEQYLRAIHKEFSLLEGRSLKITLTVPLSRNFLILIYLQPLLLKE